MFTLKNNKHCDYMKGELARIEGGLDVEELSFQQADGEMSDFALSLGVRGVPTLVKVSTDGKGVATVTEALAGYKYSRDVYSKFLEA
jgi:hypothetical protein